MECTCNKTKYGSQKEADKDIDRIRKKSKRNTIPIRSYLCKCGFWHLTSKEDKFKIKLAEINMDNKKLDSLNKEVERLGNQNKLLKEENESLKNADNKEGRHLAKVDERVKRLNEIIANKNKLISMVRKDNHELISKIVQLEKQISKNPS